MLCCWAFVSRPIRSTYFLVVIVLLTACSLLNSSDSGLTLGSEESLIGSAILVCGTECGERGQCGGSDRGEMVLINSDIPATFGHDMALPDGAEVEIVREEDRTAVQLSDNEQFPATFYLVSQPDWGQGWVAGWCIGR